MHPKIRERIERVADDDVHGASWLAREAVEAVAEAVELGEDPIELARELVRVRPALGAVAGALGRVVAAGRTPDQVVEEAHALVSARERASAAIAVLLEPRLAGVVMTHSHSATVQEALVRTPPDRVVCTVSEPGAEGETLAEELRAAGLAVDLVADDDAPHAASTVDVVVVGADTVFRDGSLLNKVGTAAITDAALEAGVPVVVACEVLKLAPVDPREPGEKRFDLTPPEQIEAYVTEEGVFPPDEIASLVDRTSFLRDGYELLLGSSGDVRRT